MFGKRVMQKTGFRCFEVNGRFMHRRSHMGTFCNESTVQVEMLADVKFDDLA